MTHRPQHPTHLILKQEQTEEHRQPMCQEWLLIYYVSSDIIQTGLCSILLVHSLVETLLIYNCISSADLIISLIFSWFRKP